MNLTFFLENLIPALVENAVIYTIFSLPAFLIFWVFFKKKYQKIRIQEVQRATNHNFFYDIKYSILTFFVSASLFTLAMYFYKIEYNLVYTDINERGWLWVGFSFCIALFINDTLFYWFHRMMHLPLFYQFFHRVHHESTDPSPFTSYAFHPSEAVLENVSMLIIPFILPIHFGVMIFIQLLDMTNNILAHLGYELYPKGWVKFPILKFKTVSTHHNMHHQLFHGNYGLYFTWWDKWMGTEFEDYENRHQEIFERDLFEKTENGTYKLSVTNIHAEPNNAFSIEFGSVPYLFHSFQAGQHVSINLKIQDKSYTRTFSLSSLPFQDPFARLTIKKIPNGIVTNYLANSLQVGDTLELSPPTGNFYLDPDPTNHNLYVMIAAGSGITPIYSMMGTILHFEPKSKIQLLYGNRNKNSVIFKDEIDHWASTYPNRFSKQYFFSEENDTEKYINRTSIESIIKNNNLLKLQFYICGPERMIETISEELLNLKIPKDQIHIELFTKSNQTTISTSKPAKIKAELQGKWYEFETDGNQTILDAGIQQNIPMPYSCQSGICGTCKMNCSEGSVEMKSNDALSKKEINQGYILTCQSMPQSESIVLKFK
ncbi:MAG: sterol desaturase family protein [Leptospira sp.]|nr:sterol desaturase family protein [Leptospira sp.]